MQGRAWAAFVVLVASAVLVPIGSAASAQDAAVCPRPASPSSPARLAGEDRVATSVLAARAGHPADEDLDEVVIAADQSFADATVGAVLGAGLQVPMVLTSPAELSDAVAALLVDLDVDEDGGVAHLVGGTEVLDPAVADALDDLGWRTERLDGEDRYDTAAQAATLVASRGGGSGPIVIATGRNWPDAAAAATYAASNDGLLVLVDGLGEPAEVDRARDREVVVVGGELAVSEDVYDALADTASSIRRLAGADRVDTAVVVARDLPGVPVLLATAANWPDPVAGATLAARRGEAVLLTQPTGLTGSVAATLTDRDVTVLGGETAVPAWLADDAGDAARTDAGAPVVLSESHVPCSGVPSLVDQPTTFQLTTNGEDLRLVSVSITPEGGGTVSGIASSTDRDEGSVFQFFLEVTPEVTEPHDIALVLEATGADDTVRTIRRGWRLDVAPVAVRAPEGWLLAAGSSEVVGTDGPVSTYTVEIADGLESRQDLAGFVAAVETTLGDPTRGWTSTGARRSQRIDDPAAARIRVLLASPATVDRLCARRGLDTAGIYSCWNGEFAALNSDRWFNGVSHVPDLALYRNYLVNHEFGHGLGFSHRACPGRGQRAPLMMQLTKSTYGCDPYGWPY